MRSISTGGRRLTHAALAGQQLALDKERQVTRKELAACARDAMKANQLAPSARAVLGELVGCFGERMIRERILVWPSNEYLTARTGLSERSVRYAVGALIQIGLITTRDSANGKRYAVRSAAREIVNAFGFDLTPLYARRGEWLLTVRAQDQAAEELRSIFEEITICRRAVEQVITTLASDYPEIDRSGLQNALDSLKRTTPRRSSLIDQERISGLLMSYRALRENAERTFYEAGNGGKSCRHIESKPPILKTEVCKKKASEEAGRGENPSLLETAPSLKLILEACPALSLYPEPITDDETLVRAGAYLRSSIGAHRDAWNEAVKTIGSLRAAILVAVTLQIHSDDVSERGVARIRNPGGYFRALVRKAAEGKYQVVVELLTLRRRHLE